MTRFEPTRHTARIRNATVAAITGATVSVHLDGTTIGGVPVYGPAPTVGQAVLILEQDAALLVVTPGGGGGVTDHGALTGLTDDDHPQYHNDARGDARYANVPSGTLLWPGSSLTPGENRITLTPVFPSYHGGVTWDPAGAFIIPKTGMYLIHGHLQFSGAPAGSQNEAGLGSMTAATNWGTYGSPTTANGNYYLGSSATELRACTINDKVAMWYYVTSGTALIDGRFSISWIGAQ